MSADQDQNSTEVERLAAARRGDAHQFSALTESYRRELQVHCYRILGSLHEAEDMVQETLLKAWKRLDTYEGRASFRSWLYKIATNSCLDFLDRRKSRRLLPFEKLSPADPMTPILPPTTEISWLEPFPDEWLGDKSALNPEARYSDSESISLAFLAALQVLPPRQRAVLILRDVLDFSAVETADVLELTVSSVNSALHRARTTLSQRYPHGEMEDSTMPPTDERTQWLLDHFVQAWENADVNGLVALLKADAALAMPPSPSWYQGQNAIGTFVAGTVFGEGGMFTGQALNRWRLLPTRANGSPAFAIYQRDEQNEYLPFGLIVLTIEGDKLSQIISFIDPSLPPLFGFPAALGKS
ncbi:MAG TPA: sigma-70 family RNA polymerase sigma factor [Anaerolineales bacterium]|nr:sigma-70 family RNA polymerase sigma factor [Anaerolineales bacterium]